MADEPKEIRPRYFPVSQTINTDPEIRELKAALGLPGFSMWLEVLARTDKDPLWKGSEKNIASVLAGVCQSNTRGARRVLEWLTDRVWIRWQRGSVYPHRGGLNYTTEGVTDLSQRGSEEGNREGLILVNWSKYHKTRSAKKLSTGEQKSPLPTVRPNHPNLLNLKDAVPPPVDNSPPPAPEAARPEPQKKGNGLDLKLKEAYSRVYDKDRTKFDRIIVWVNLRLKEGLTPEMIADALAKFEPYAKDIEDWWPYLDKLALKAYAESNQAESGKYKGVPEPAREILKRVAKEV